MSLLTVEDQTRRIIHDVKIDLKICAYEVNDCLRIEEHNCNFYFDIPFLMLVREITNSNITKKTIANLIDQQTILVKLPRINWYLPSLKSFIKDGEVSLKSTANELLWQVHKKITEAIV